MEVTLSKAFPHVDKICDASFLKRVTGIATKKDSTRFILSNPDCKAFFGKMETELIQVDSDAQNKIERYFTTITDELKSFKSSIKAAKEKETIDKKLAEREALKAELRRELEQEKEQQATRAELDMPAEVLKLPTPNTPIEASKASGSFDTPVDRAEEMDLDRFFKFLKRTVELDMISIRDINGTVLPITQVEFDQQIIKFSVKTPQQTKIKL
jgi:hypothetical protein